MKHNVFIRSERETQTTYHEDGMVDINLCSFERDRALGVVPWRNGDRVAQKGRMLTEHDGTSHFIPYRSTGMQRYERLIATRRSTVKRCRKAVIVSMRFPADSRHHNLGKLIGDEARTLRSVIGKVKDDIDWNKPYSFCY